MGVLNEKERSIIFSRMICRRKIGVAINYISDRLKGRILIPGDTIDKTGELIKEISMLKNPE